MGRDVLWFKEINKDMIPIVGGKGANLGEMENAGFPVPGGFVITSEAYTKNAISNNILSKIEFIEKNINVDDTRELNEKSEFIRNLIKKSTVDSGIKKSIIDAYSKLGRKSYVAVRSSATAEDLPSASFAGQQDTYLNIVGEEKLINAVRMAWASLFNARAIYYRRKQNFPIEKVKIAIVVQKMIESEISGIMFTANPITSNLDEILIEAGYGLGEAIVSGSVTPDTYSYSKKENKITSKVISSQTWKYIKSSLGNSKADVEQGLRHVQKLSDKYILSLAKIGYDIEKHYGKPQDIEWALEEGKLYIVQSRPITTIKETTSIEHKAISLKPILSGLGASTGLASGPVRLVIDMKDLEKVKVGDILVTTMTTPDMVPAMQKAIAIVTDEGGITSHAAIVSRELGIPAIVGTTKATQMIKDGDIISVDAYQGRVYSGRIEFSPKSDQSHESDESLNLKTNTLVKVNIALSSAAKRAANTKADGIGLLRAEHLITARSTHPVYLINEGRSEELKELLKDELREILREFSNKPVFYRTFDARTDEFRQLIGGDKEPHEINPMLGWHGIRRSLDVPELLKTEFRALKELSNEGFNNVGIMIPFTQSVEEYKIAKELAKSVGLVPHKDCRFGIMVETPGAALTISEYIKEGLDFISFGTNDLTQLTLGIDRNNETIQKWFTELHPAIIKQIEMVITECKKAGVETSICGQAGSNPEMVKILLRLGINSVSANIDAVAKIRKVVYNAENNL